MNHRPAGPKSGKFQAVLLLAPPPAPWKTTDWYCKPIAGVPFLLRNILNIQRGGAERLILYIRNNGEIDAELRRRVANDSRVRLPVQWVATPRQLAEQIDANPILVLEGSALHHKTEIAAAMASGMNEENAPINAATLNSLLLQIDDFNSSRLEQARSSAEPGGANTEGRILSYLPGAENHKVLRAEDFPVQHERLMQTGGGLSNDSFLTRLFSRPVSRLMTRFLINTPFTPNQITLLSFVLGLGSAWCFFHLDYSMGLAGGGLLLLAIWVDGVDGEIARLKFMETKIGGKLDIICDNIVHVILFFSIGMGLYDSTGRTLYRYLGVLAALGSLVSFLLMGAAVIESKADATASAKPAANNLADKLANRDFTYFLLLTALAGKVEWFLWATAIGSNIFALYLSYCKVRQLTK
ncbi:MAG: CDP-alcohol phosphatidyltransferase family protein [Nitrospinales bacterium]